MRISSSLNEHGLISHPTKPLKEHLLNVGTMSKNIVASKKLNICIDSLTLQEIAYLTGIFHDFGKATSYFQDYIKEEDEDRRAKLKNKPETSHSLISAIFTYYAVKAYLRSRNLIERDYYRYLPLIGFFVVRRHHGNLHNADDELMEFNESTQQVLEKQIESIDFDVIENMYRELSTFDLNLSEIRAKFERNYERRDYRRDPESGVVVTSKRYLGLLKDFEEDRKLLESLEHEPSLVYYFITLLLYSVLLDADKLDAADIELTERIEIEDNVVDVYKEHKIGRRDTDERIDKMRNAIYDDVMANLNRIDLDRDRIMSLNAPTGTGKTLTALAFALKLRREIESRKGYKPRIIYSLPFLSIIDQNFAVYEDVFETVHDAKPTSDLLLKHHHLSDIGYTRRNTNIGENDTLKDLLFIEGWHSEIIVTTFVQFFHSLISNRNRTIRKVHNMVNSIVILDEVQAIPHKYWLLLNRALKVFATQFNSYFILATATQPLIFDESNAEIVPLVTNKESYFKSLSRVKLMTYLEPITIEEFERHLKQDISHNADKDFLIVLNTIRTSKEIYNFVRDLDLENTSFYYLSAAIIPGERLKRIRAIKEEVQNRKIIVSTQLIEAGVDIDADIVYRDLAPLDSINQVAGRCNRNFSSNKTGIVKIFILKEEGDGRTYYPHTIYENFIISKTMDVFNELPNKEIEESEFMSLNAKYFEKVNTGKSDDESKNILNKVETLKFGELSDFRLIEEDYPEVDVFIEYDDHAREIWHKYTMIKSTTDGIARKKLILEIKREFYDYVISVPMRFKNQVGFDAKAGIGHISKDEIDQGLGYDPETGFKADSGGGTLIW